MLNGAPITAKNYAAQAVVGLREWGRHATKEDRSGAFSLAELIERGVHFAIPDLGRIFDDGLRGLDGVALRLPYEAVTVEFYVPRIEAKLTDVTPEYSPRRVVYLEEMGRAKIDSIRRAFFEQGWGSSLSPMPDPDRLDGERFIWMAAACFMASTGQWHPMGASWLFQAEGWRKGEDDEAISVAGEMGLVLPDYTLGLVKKLGSADRAREVLRIDIDSELRSSLEFMEAFSCANIKETVHSPGLSAEKNAKRVRAGNRPILETKTLTVDFSFRGDDGQPVLRGPIDGRASPREHLRRGHVRRLPRSEDRIWIPPTLVNPGISAGRVEKQYRVKR